MKILSVIQFLTSLLYSGLGIVSLFNGIDLDPWFIMLSWCLVAVFWMMYLFLRRRIGSCSLSDNRGLIALLLSLLSFAGVTCIGICAQFSETDLVLDYKSYSVMTLFATIFALMTISCATTSGQRGPTKKVDE